MMCFSNKVQVKYNLLENLHLKISERETKAGLCKRFFNFSIFSVWNRVDLLKIETCLYSIKLGAWLTFLSFMSAFQCKKYWFKKPVFVQITVDVADFNKTKIKTESVYINATRYIVPFSLYIIIA